MPSPSRSEQLADPNPSASESPSPTLLEDPTPSSPFFTPPRSPDTSSPDPEEPSLWSPDEEQAADPAPASPSDTRSTRKRFRALLPTVRQGVLIAGGLANQLLTRPGSAQRDGGLWLPDEDDVEGIATPLASLASRRAPEGVANPDTVDLVSLAAAVLGYVMKQRERAAQLAPEPVVLEDQAPADAYAGSSA